MDKNMKHICNVIGMNAMSLKRMVEHGICTLSDLLQIRERVKTEAFNRLQTDVKKNLLLTIKWLENKSSMSSTTLNIKKRPVLDGDNNRAKTKPKNQEPKTKLAAYDIDWFDSSATMKKCLKHTNIKNLPVTQEGCFTFLLSKFETVDLKTAFAYTIGKVRTPAKIAFYPLPLRKDKVIRSFLKLIYNGRSIIVDNSKDAFR